MADQPNAEIWQPVPNYIGYEVSDFGRIRSLDRMVVRKNGAFQKRSGSIMTPSTDSSGYFQIKLTNDTGIRTAISLHRIVALVFVPNSNPELLVEVNHENGIKKDNYFRNLKWVTSPDNKKHALETGLIKRGADLSYSKPVLDLQTGIFYDSISEAAIAKNIKNRTLHHWLIGDRTNRSSLVLV